MFGICNLSIIPCRSQPSDKSEMVTQLLFGEQYQILREEEKWLFIKIAADNYECWIDKKQYQKITEQDFNLLNNEPQRLSMEIVKKTGKDTNIVLGSVLPNLKKGRFEIAEEKFYFRGKTVLSHKKSNRNNLIRVAKMYLNAPYLWGGRSPFGLDCSGFTQMVFRLNGIQLPRDAYQQAEKGDALNFIEEAQKGDLAFFDNEEGQIIHVGIIISPVQMKPVNSSKQEEEKFKGARIIHSSGKVRIDALDHYGIFNAEKGRYSHNLRLLKKVF